MIYQNIENLNLKIKHYKSTNNIIIEDISEEFCKILNYSKQELLGVCFKKILDHSIILTIEDCILLNDGDIEIIEILNRIMEFRFIKKNNIAIICKIKAFSFVSDDFYEAVTYIKISSVDIKVLWDVFTTEYKLHNDTLLNLAALCKFSGIYNINSIVVVIECNTLNSFPNKDILINYINTDLLHIDGVIFNLAYIGGDFLMGVICPIEEEKLHFLLGKIYQRIDNVLKNNKINIKITMEYDLLLKYGRYNLSRISSIDDVLKITIK